jgi:hypothetical protein
MNNISLRKALLINCTDCVYDPQAKGTARYQIENCNCPACEFYDHRPRSKEARAKIRADYLATLTPEQLELERIKTAQKSERMRLIRQNQQ